MSDEEEFRGYFPGSKVPLPTGPTPPRKRREIVTGWDDRPVRKHIKGEVVEMFTIGAVCKALGRPPVTIRHWIRQGHLPKAPFKMPDKNGIAGRRLYTRAHIEALIRVAQAHGIIDNSRVDWSQHPTFADDVRKEWASLTVI